jgi:DNA-binding HxlR family transcriptional regulator
MADRTGTQALRLLATPINVNVIQALAEGPRPLFDLRQAAGFPPQTTMRGNMRLLSRTGLLTQHRQAGFPGPMDVELLVAGRELLFVNESLRAWLLTAPTGPIELGSSAAKGAVKALVEAWASSIMRALAARPLLLTELDSVIRDLSYPALERRLGAMKVVGQVERMPGRAGTTPYAATEWLRRAMSPIIAAVRWERRYLREQTVPIKSRDVEAAFLLAVPLLAIPIGSSGICRMAIELRGADQAALSGVRVRIEDGRLVECSSRLEGPADASIIGSAEAWLTALGDGEQADLELSGSRGLAADLVDGLHRTLFGGGASSATRQLGVRS